jgi:hypothetical protein
MVDTTYTRVGHSLRTGRFPLLYGADCAVLLAAIPALRDTAGRAGLLFVDAHEDATTMEQSDTGEAASMEIALLLGLTGTYAPEPLRSRLPALNRDTIVMLGQRDRLYRRQIGLPPSRARFRCTLSRSCAVTPRASRPMRQSTLPGTLTGGGRTSISTCSRAASSRPATRPPIPPLPAGSPGPSS